MWPCQRWDAKLHPGIPLGKDSPHYPLPGDGETMVTQVVDGEGGRPKIFQLMASSLLMPDRWSSQRQWLGTPVLWRERWEALRMSENDLRLLNHLLQGTHRNHLNKRKISAIGLRFTGESSRDVFYLFSLYSTNIMRKAARTKGIKNPWFIDQ